MTDIPETLDLLVALLERMSLEYVVMAGLAVRSYSIPRATYDIDFTIALDHKRLPELFDALEEQEYVVPEPYRTGWVDTVKGLEVVKLKRYIGDQSLDVDLFLSSSEFQQEVLKRKRLVEVEGRKLWLVSPEDLILLKLLADRPRDLVDVADVLFMQGQLDVQYMRHWAAELGIAQELEQALADRATDG
ncbi:MAG: nucleotidyltransferase [Pirellulales bacterium]